MFNRCGYVESDAVLDIVSRNLSLFYCCLQLSMVSSLHELEEAFLELDVKSFRNLRSLLQNLQQVMIMILVLGCLGGFAAIDLESPFDARDCFYVSSLSFLTSLVFIDGVFGVITFFLSAIYITIIQKFKWFDLIFLFDVLVAEELALF